MRPPIDGATILITGASAGIGREMARLLGPRARSLVIVARRAERLRELAAELVAETPTLVVSVQPCDLMDLRDVERMLEALRVEGVDVDVLINNAGLGDAGLFENSAWEKNQQMLRVDVEALLFLTHRLLPPMVARGRGGILNVSSGFGLSFLPGFAAYVGAKHFVSGFTEALRLEARSAGVVVSQLCPGPVRTEFNAVAGVPPVVDPPLVTLSAPRCARWALASFERGRALIVPGWGMKLVLLLGALTPRWLLRLLYAPLGRILRKRSAGSGS